MWVAERTRAQEIIIGNVFDQNGRKLPEIRVFVSDIEDSRVRLSVFADTTVTLRRGEKNANRFNSGPSRKPKSDLE